MKSGGTGRHMQSYHFSQQCPLRLPYEHISSAAQPEDRISSMLPCHLLRGDDLLPAPWQKLHLFLQLPPELQGLKQSKTHFGSFPGEGQGASLPALLPPVAPCGPLCPLPHELLHLQGQTKQREVTDSMAQPCPGAPQPPGGLQCSLGFQDCTEQALGRQTALYSRAFLCILKMMGQS